MNPQQILNKVQEGADARFGETIERLLSALRRHHGHNSWKNECFCEYCRFIVKEYTDEKIRLHRLRVRLRIIDNEYSDNHRPDLLDNAIDRVIKQQNLVWEMKEQKKVLQTSVL